ncbi:MAG TPA: SPFH domain-containing protein [Candidatus Eisenbacteria bacterium]|jgi:regulator of protease activity HflC (stomatin/prohibitin superfamily)|nr:SPFH domain-containing protein [Candidatus Eisenbacteria bacterium]
MKGLIAAVAAAFVVLVFILTFGWIDVAPTEVAVEINKVAGKVNDMPRTVGYHFFNRWVTDMVIYRVGARSFPPDTMESEDSRKYTLDLKTNDGQNVSVDLTIIYALMAPEVPLLHQKVGPNFEDQILLPQIRSEARLAIGSHSAEEIYQGKVRDTIQISIKEKLQQAVSKFPAIQIQDALIRHFKFSEEFERAIEQKKLAAQQVEINKNKALAQEEEAKRIEAEARGQKLRVLQEAEGGAQSVKIRADAQRYQLEQEAAGKLAIYKAEAEGKKLLAEALGGGQNVVALKFAEMIPDKLEIWGIPTGQNNTSLMDVSGVFGNMFHKKEA